MSNVVSGRSARSWSIGYVRLDRKIGGYRREVRSLVLVSMRRVLVLKLRRVLVIRLRLCLSHMKSLKFPINVSRGVSIRLASEVSRSWSIWIHAIYWGCSACRVIWSSHTAPIVTASRRICASLPRSRDTKGWRILVSERLLRVAVLCCCTISFGDIGHKSIHTIWLICLLEIVVRVVSL